MVACSERPHEIAERLVVRPPPQETHVKRAMLKLHAHDRAKLVVFGYEGGLVVPRANPAPPHPLSLVAVDRHLPSLEHAGCWSLAAGRL